MTRRLTDDERAYAQTIIDTARISVAQYVGSDRELLHMMRRYVFKALLYDERSTPAARIKLKRQKHLEQNGKCAQCGQDLELRYSELDRKVAMLGYTSTNTRLVHHGCHIDDQTAKGYA